MVSGELSNFGDWVESFGRTLIVVFNNHVFKKLFKLANNLQNTFIVTQCI